MEEQKPIKETIQAIAFELRESGASEWEVLKIIKELEGFSGSEPALRKKSSELLDKLNPAAAKTFRSFEKMRVFTSGGRREPFDRGNIIKSLLKETSVSRHVAEKIGAEVEDRIKDLKLGELNTQIIREMVNVKLLEYGHEGVHNEYARIGIPVFEAKKKLDENFENPEILQEYNWLAAIPKGAKELHFDGAIHLYAPQDFSTKLFSDTIFLHGEREDVALQAQNTDLKLSMPLTLAGFNHAFAKTQKSRKKIASEAGLIAKTFRLTGKKRIAELALFSDYEWAGMQAKSAYVNLANALYENADAAKAFDFAISVDSKYKLKLAEKTLPHTIVLNNSKERVTMNPKAILCANTGLIQLTAINLQKLLEHSGEQDGFLEKLSETLEKIDKACEKKKTELAKRPYIEKRALENKTSAIALAGILKTAKTLSETNPAKTAESIITLVQKNGFVACQMDSSDCARIFGIAEDRKETQEILLKLAQKQRKTFGFIYRAQSAKEAEDLLSDCPCVEILQANDKA